MPSADQVRAALGKLATRKVRDQTTSHGGFVVGQLGAASASASVTGADATAIVRM
jgi:hypothetical protein